MTIIIIILVLNTNHTLCVGAFGVDFTHDCGEGLEIVRKRLLQYGVTGFCPTIISTTNSNYHKVLFWIIISLDD